jgi:23S rRNA (cytosine1962-C5)-methyltransferase
VAHPNRSPPKSATVLSPERAAGYAAATMGYHALTLTPALAAALDAGRRDLEQDAVPGADRCEAGQPVRLLSPAGDLLAIALADPENELVRVFALQSRNHTTLDPRFLRERVERALALRRAFGLEREHTAHRLIHGAGDGLPGLTVDLYGDFAVLCAYSRGLMSLARQLGTVVRDVLRLEGVVIKLRTRDAAQTSVKQEVLGESPPERTTVHEGDVPYEVHLLAGLNVGLFTDMREHRAGLARFVRGKRVLNTFSYTGSLSVVAARAGATQVTSVDLSAGVQNWARANFALSGLAPAAHRFENQEISSFFKKMAREGERFDVIIVDPPTYSAARAGAWSMRKDYPALIERACESLESGGILWLSANSRELPPLPDVARDAFQRAGRQAQLLSTGSLPPDYPTLSAQPEDRYLQVCLFCVE